MKALDGAAVRFDPGAARRDAYEGIHRARYRFAASHAETARVLDVACGSAYGLPVLETTAREVIGVDIDAAALRRARAVSRPRRSTLLAADGCRLPFSNGCFDVVTSFETLEHLERRREFVFELRRVLRSGGLLILSTPNSNVTEPIDGKPRNPHHVYEYRPSELKTELEAAFSDVELLGQVLDSRFKVSPFRDDQQRRPKSIRIQGELLLWRILYKLPTATQDRLSHLLWGHPLVAGEGDYEFRRDVLDRAPVLVALCRGYSRGR